MMLLDVNVLIALADADHTHHQRAQRFFETHRETGWATCPITENGFLRILGGHNYPKGPGSPALAQELLNGLCSIPRHEFWPDMISLRSYSNLPSSKKLTDHYLLALTIHKSARLATLDTRIDPTPFAGGREAYLVID
ncbi:MAG: TA system VapC family ribonuclease toxin [Verrucomicrobiota bacterium]